MNMKVSFIMNHTFMMNMKVLFMKNNKFMMNMEPLFIMNNTSIFKINIACVSYRVTPGFLIGYNVTYI